MAMDSSAPLFSSMVRQELNTTQGRPMRMAYCCKPRFSASVSQFRFREMRPRVTAPTMGAITVRVDMSFSNAESLLFLFFSMVA